MAKKTETIVTLTDDLDGSKAERTLTFAYAGTTYELELSKKNIAAFEKAIAPYVEHGRRASSPSRRGAGRRSATGGARASRPDLTAIRDWAKSQGIEISARGRISRSVQDAYSAAN